MSTVQQQLDVRGMSAMEYDQAARHHRERVSRLQAEARGRGDGRQRSEGTQLASVRQKNVAVPLRRYGDDVSAASSHPGSGAVSTTDEVTGETIVMPGTDMGSIHITARRRVELQQKFGTAALRLRQFWSLGEEGLQRHMRLCRATRGRRTRPS